MAATISLRDQIKKELRLQSKEKGRLQKIAKQYDIKDPDSFLMNDLINLITDAMMAAKEEEPEEEKPVKKSKKETPKPDIVTTTKKKKPVEKEPAKPDSNEQVKIKPHHNETPLTNKRPGITALILECLRNASSEKPITKPKIIATILSKYPNRDPLKTKTFVAGAPSMLKIQKGLHCSSRSTEEGRGFWLEPAETIELGKERLGKIKQSKT